MSNNVKTLLALLALHSVLDCYAGIWPIYKHLAGISLGVAGLIATLATTVTWVLQPYFGIWADKGYARVCVIAGTVLTFPMMLLGPVTGLLPSLPTWGGYGILFAAVFLAKLGQAMYHPAGASISGNLDDGRRSTMVALFVAFGWIGYGSSQLVFSYTFRWANTHTEWLLIPGGLVVLGALRWCFPKELHHQGRAGLISSITSIPFGRKRLYVLFAMLCCMSALGQGLFFLLPEFMEAKGYSSWFVHGGALLWIVAGSVIGIVPAGYLADTLGRHRVLVLSLLANLILFFAFVWTPLLPTYGIALLCMGVGAAMNMANPIGVAIGQHLFPEQRSLISGVLMGLSWAVGGTAPWIMGVLASRSDIGIVNALAMLWVAGVLAFGMSLFIETDMASDGDEIQD